MGHALSGACGKPQHEEVLGWPQAWHVKEEVAGYAALRAGFERRRAHQASGHKPPVNKDDIPRSDPEREEALGADRSCHDASLPVDETA